ncbi:MAG: pimeloyl-ACP methyl ester esterase BioH [Arsenophonus sp.]
MTKLSWRQQQLDKEKKHIVLLHGWGLNATVWDTIKKECASYFYLHIVDLPGYGYNNFFPEMSLEKMAELIWKKAPKKAIWVGWSLGGLIASIIALNHQSEISGLITVSSSPCFIQKEKWPGIKSELLISFEQQLKTNFHRIIEHFLTLQTLGTKTENENIQLLKLLILKQPLPSSSVLKAGLEILRTTDLRQSLLRINKPFLRIYGDLDSLVPRKIASIIDGWLPKSRSVIIKHAAHAVFISHPKQFITLLVDFSLTVST